jgi:Fe-S oxidoreductase
VLDWSAWPGAAGGLQGAVEMCNNNGACRSLAGGVMCPSYRATRDERDVTRGRANTLRLAITGQLGPDALASDAMAEIMSLCVSCKACRRECPTGVDMARMKIEVQAARIAHHGLSLRDRLVGYLPRYAPYAAKLAWLMNLRDRLPGVARLSEALTGFSASRPLPKWRSDVFEDDKTSWLGSSRPSTSFAEHNVDARYKAGHDAGEVVLFADTFNRYFERENLDAALAVLNAAGYRVHVARAPERDARPLCCGRTFLSVGLVAEARAEAERTLAALAPYLARSVPVVGLEPSCILGFRDEIPALLKTEAAAQLAASSFLFEEFLMREHDAGRLSLPFKSATGRVLLHGHCHQKSFGAFTPVQRALGLVPGLAVETVESSCCGMAGAFGYGAETIDVSRAMGELSLLPAVRKADPATTIVADGTSCRQQIFDGSEREALHVARVLAAHLASDDAGTPAARGH